MIPDHYVALVAAWAAVGIYFAVVGFAAYAVFVIWLRDLPDPIRLDPEADRLDF